MNYFYIIVNREKHHSQEVADHIQTFLEQRGCICRLDKAKEDVLVTERNDKGVDTIPENTQCVITLGGDGTLIQAARNLADINLPVIGINMGSLGYLTQVSAQSGIDEMLEDLIADRYYKEERMMLSGEVVHSDGTVFVRDKALNDIVLTRKGILRVVKFRVYINEECFTDYSADGMIVATPTGSTAYNLSAGGPVVIPDANLMVLTPICAHSLNDRSMILSERDHIRIEILGHDDDGQVAVFDGDHTVALRVGDYLDIRKAKKSTTLIKRKTPSFLENLRDKMSGI